MKHRIARSFLLMALVSMGPASVSAQPPVICPPPPPAPSSPVATACNPSTASAGDRGRYRFIDNFEWRPLGRGGGTRVVQCGVVRGSSRGPSGEPQIVARTIRDLGAELVWTDYFWHDEDGFQMSVWRDVEQPTHVWINFAGSIPAPFGPDITTLWQNVWDENSVASSYPRFILQALQDLEANYLRDGDTLYFTGHSQGGNVAQMVAFALATFFRYDATFESTTFTPGYLPQWPNREPDTYRALSNRLFCRNIQIGGGVAYAARPMHYWARINELMAGEGQAFTMVAAIDDVVPQLGVAATWFDDPNRVTVWNRARAAIRVATIGAALSGRPGFLLVDLRADIVPNLVAVSAVTPPWVPNLAYVSPRVRTIADRAQVLFEDDVRPDGFNVHGNAYIDPNVTGRLGSPVPPSLDGLRIGSELWGPWLNDRIERPLRGIDDVFAIDLADSSRRSVPVVRNDLVRAEAFADARIRSVRIDRWHTKRCLEEAGFEVAIAADGREIEITPPSSTEVAARCVDGEGEANDRDLTIEYELGDGVRARLLVDVHHSAWGAANLGPSWLNEPTSPWTEGPYFWAPPAGTPTVIPTLAPLTSFAPQHRRTVRDSTPVGAEMSLVFVAGYGVDCYGGRRMELTSEIPSRDVLLCNDDGTRNASVVDIAQVAYRSGELQPLECQDGIPDTTWVQLFSESSGAVDGSYAGLYRSLEEFRNTYEGPNPWDEASALSRAPWLNRFWYTCGATRGFEGMCPAFGDGSIDYGALMALHEEFRRRDPRNVVVEVPGARDGACAPLVTAPLYVPCSATDGAPYLGRPAGGAVDVNVTGGLLGSRMWLWHVSYTVLGMADRGLLLPGDADGTGSFYSSSTFGNAVEACSSAMEAGPFGGRAIATPIIAFPDRAVPPEEVARVGLDPAVSWCADTLVLKFSTSMYRCNPGRVEGTNYIALWPET